MLHSVPHLGPKGIAKLLSEVAGGLPDDLVNLDKILAWKVSPDTLQKEYGLHPEAALCLGMRKEELLKTSKEMAESAKKLGIRVITYQDSDYPAVLSGFDAQPPPILYAHGNLGLLRDRKFAVVSSSTVSAHSIEVTREFAGTLCDQGMVLVTSHNTHPYQVSGLAARSRNASVILVLDRGILSAFPHGLGFEPVAQARIWDLRFDPKRDLVVSRYRLYDRWIGANARERDHMVFGLADVVVAVEVRSGGVMEAECVHARKQGREVYVYAPSEGAPSGNQSLLDGGCPPIPSPTARSLLTTLDLLHEPVGDLFEEIT